MAALPGWKSWLVLQKNGPTGCVPVGFQMLLRANALPIKNEATFQDRYDGAITREGPNNFEAVRDRVVAEHRDARFKIDHHKTGADKVRFLEEQLRKGIPTVVSVLVQERGSGNDFHIYLVVEDLGDSFRLGDGSPSGETILKKSDIAKWQDAHPGTGDDTAYVQK